MEVNAIDYRYKGIECMTVDSTWFPNVERLNRIEYESSWI